MKTYLEKLAWGAGSGRNPFQAPQFDWNQFNQENYGQQQAQPQQGGGGGFNPMALLPFLGMLGNNKAEEAPVGLGQRFSNAGKAIADTASGAADFASGFTVPNVVDGLRQIPGMATDGWGRMGKGFSDIWNRDATGSGWGDVGMGALTGVGLPAVGGLAAYSGIKNFINPMKSFGQLTNPGMGAVGNWANKGLSALNKVPLARNIASGISNLAGMGPAGSGVMGAVGKALAPIAVAGGVVNSWRDTEQGTDLLGDKGGFYGLGGGMLGEYGEGLSKEMGNLTTGAMGGAQMGGLPGALAGVAAQAPGNVYRVRKGIYDIGKAWSDGAAADATTAKMQDRIKQQQAIQRSMGYIDDPESGSGQLKPRDESARAAWNAHVQAQRAAGKKSWDAPVGAQAMGQAVGAAPAQPIGTGATQAGAATAKTPAPITPPPAPAQPKGPTLAPDPKATGPTPSAAVK